MSDVPTYAYALENRLRERNTYFYTQFEGEPFLVAWQASRAAARAELGEPNEAPAPTATSPAPAKHGEVDTRALLEHLISAPVPSAEGWLDRLIQRFEVSKRFYRTYRWTARGLRAVRASGFDDLGLYVSAGHVFDRAYQQSARLQYLNVLLKLDDTLISVRSDLSVDQRSGVARLLSSEHDHVLALATKLGVSW